MRARTRLALGLAACSTCLLAPATATAANGWLPAEILGAGTNVSVAGNESGTIAAAWTASGAVHARVRSAAGVWGPVEEVASGAGLRPDLAVDAAGNAYFAWAPFSAGLVWLRKRNAAGVYSSPELLTPLLATGSEVDLAVNSAGDAAAVWREGAPQQNRIRMRTRSAAGALSGPDYVSQNSADPAAVPAAEQGFDPRVAVAPDGDAVLVYEVGSMTKRVATNVRDSATGTLTPPSSGPPAELDPAGVDPSVSVDGAGNATYVWDGAAIETRSRSTAGVFSPTQAISDGVLAQIASVGVSSGGTARFTWSDRADPAADLAAKTRTRAPGGELSPVTPLSTVTATVFAAALAVNGAGDALAAWRFSGEGIQGRALPVGENLTAPEVLASGSVADPRMAIDGAGNGVAVVAADGQVTAAAFDATPPAVVRPQVPARVERGVPVSLSVNASDNWPGPLAVRWEFGDGTSAEGTSVTHAWTRPGNYPISVTATDAAGNATTVAGSWPATVTDSISPRLTRVSLRRKRLRFTLSEPASVRLTVARKAGGRRVGRRCRRGRPRAGQRRCVRYVPIKGAVRYRGAEGRNVKPFTRKIGRRKLRRGVYRLTLVATDPFANPSRRVRVGLRVRR